MARHSTSEDSAPANDPNAKFTVFHFRDGEDPVQSGTMSVESPKPSDIPAIQECVAAGIGDGSDVRVVFSGFGMSIVHCWFKRSFPLPPHSHDCDCAYYVIAGSLRLGARDLGPGDGFFIPAGIAYTYQPGPEGVEVIEFRSTETFDFKSKANASFYAKAKTLVEANLENWKTARRPSSIA